MSRLRRRPYRIEKTEQLELLSSPIRQEIVDAVAALGECSARELAPELGVAPDALYYHLKKLVAAGLLVSVGQRAATRRPEEIYRTAAREMLMVWDLDDPQASAAILKAMAAVLRMGERDFRRGAELETARPGTRDRNLGGGRVTAWLTRGELEQVNRLLGRVEQIFHGARRTRSRELVSLTWLIAPMESKERP